MGTQVGSAHSSRAEAAVRRPRLLPVAAPVRARSWTRRTRSRGGRHDVRTAHGVEEAGCGQGFLRLGGRVDWVDRKFAEPERHEEPQLFSAKSLLATWARYIARNHRAHRELVVGDTPPVLVPWRCSP